MANNLDVTDTIGRGRDLTDPERAFVYTKSMQIWESERSQVKAGDRKIIPPL